MKSDEKQEKQLLLLTIFTLGGLFGIVSSWLIPNVEVAFFLFCVSVTFALIGIAIAFKFFWTNDKKFRQNKRGALWIWAVCLMSIVTLAIAWFALTWPVFMFIDAIQEHYDFPAQVQPAISLIVAVMGWFLILMSLGLLLWAYVNSQRREDVTYPVG